MNGAFASEERKGEEEGSQLIKAIFPDTFAAMKQSKYHTSTYTLWKMHMHWPDSSFLNNTLMSSLALQYI